MLIPHRFANGEIEWRGTYHGSEVAIVVQRWRNRWHWIVTTSANAEHDDWGMTSWRRPQTSESAAIQAAFACLRRALHPAEKHEAPPT